MKFNIYGRFQVDVHREQDAWVVYRSEAGKRVVLHDIVVPADVTCQDMATYLDDIFHEAARSGDTVERMAD